ncbi:hypothetical protein EI982_14675 [Haloplanus rallus]|uniref:Uncharacterized protein n=1 Tax=Haloplanus rallus TaxID=1816183 RepID=A0A6B9FFH4_9EURY|nr:hypothetical protein [Haloplanus rallus]QGX95940.1 hypothetical protein EI982_14675 [Haloplanus rallus]
MSFEESNRLKTLRRREKRAVATIEVTFDEKSAYECPKCGDEERIGIYGRDYDEPSFLPCSAWGCDALLKFVDDGDREDPEPSGQVGLAQFTGGDSA